MSEPYTGAQLWPARRGKTSISRCFESLALLKITRFEPQTIFDGGDKFFVLIKCDGAAHGKGYAFPNNGHRWQLHAAGKVVGFDHVTATAQMIRMVEGE